MQYHQLTDRNMEGKVAYPMPTIVGQPILDNETIKPHFKQDIHMDLRIIDASQPLPFCEPNITPGNEYEGITNIINVGSADIEKNGCFWWCCSLACCCLPLCCNAKLIPAGEIGLATDNGVPSVLNPGWHFLLRPFTSLDVKRPIVDQVIQHGQVCIVRVLQGQIGLAYMDSSPKLLLPGLHCYNSPVFRFNQIVDLKNPHITHGPVQIFTVASGTVRVCYDSGAVKIFEAGRYGVYNANFQLSTVIPIQQQNLPFEKHQVLLEGGINLLVQGLLTYQVTDVAKLITQLGETDLKRAIQDTTKAELARVFAGIHLEQISSQDANREQKSPTTDEDALLGKSSAYQTVEGGKSDVRNWICAQVVQDISPLTAGWGVKIINFQLESTRIADERYAREYEEASLAMAKAKANRRALDTQNDILIKTAEAKSRAAQLQAEGEKQAAIKMAEARAESVLVEAKANAAARLMEADARNESAVKLSNEFGRQLAMMDRNVGIAEGLKATTLVITPDAGIARSVLTPTPGAIGFHK